MWLFAKKKTPQELLRENKRTLDKSIREIERERASLQTQEKKLIAEIKKMAKQNQMGAVKVRLCVVSCRVVSYRLTSGSQLRGMVGTRECDWNDVASHEDDGCQTAD